MDKLKPVWKVIKKYHIWVLCIAVVGTAVFGLFMANGTLAAQADKTKKEVDDLAKKSRDLAIQPNPPNEKWVAEKDKQIEAERARNRRIWESLYEWQQRQFKWPEKLGGLTFASQLADQGAQTRLIKEHEDAFEKYSSEAFDDLLKIVNAEANYTARAPVEEEDEKKSGRRAAAEKKKPVATIAPVRSPYVVGWLASSQSRIHDPLVNWGDENRFGRPTKTRVLDTQRDLWIYESLLKAIAKTNGDAAANYIAKVKYILDLQVGKDVQPLQQRVATKARSRSVRGNFNGIESVPVRLNVIADQRHLTTLLAELANAPLQVEISGFSARYTPKRRVDEKQGDPRKGQKQDVGPLYTIVDSYDVQVSIEGKVNFYKDPDKHLPSGP